MPPARDWLRIAGRSPLEPEVAELATAGMEAQFQRDSVRAALAVLAKVTQPSLIEFLR